MTARTILGLALLTALLGCGRAPVAEPIDTHAIGPEQMILYSIDPKEDDEDFRPTKTQVAGESFHGYPVLGKLEIDNQPDRNLIKRQLEQAIKTAKRDRMVKCFWPRHGIRISNAGTARDFLICFQCNQFIEYQNDKNVRHEALHKDPQADLNARLMKANIPMKQSPCD